MKCSQCSQEIIEVSSFCPHCGSPVGSIQVDAPEPEPPSVYPQAVPKVEVALDKNNIIVSQRGDGHFATIQDAVTVAKPGAVILIKAGRYSEVLVLDKPLTLAGEEGAQVYVENVEFPVLRVTNTQAILRNLVLGVSQSETGSIIIKDSDVQFNGCLLVATGSQEADIPLARLKEKYTTVPEIHEQFNAIAFPYQDTQFQVTGKVSRLTLDDCCLANLTLQIREEGCLAMTDTLLLRSTVHGRSQADLKFEQCTFYSHNRAYPIAAIMLDDCSAGLWECKFACFFTGVITARSKTSVNRCHFLGLRSESKVDMNALERLRNTEEEETFGDWWLGNAILAAEARKDEVKVGGSTFALCQTGIAAGELHGMHGIPSPTTYKLGMEIEGCEFLENKTAIQVQWDLSPRAVDLHIRVESCKFNKNETHAISFSGKNCSAAPLGRIEVRDCSFKDNKGTAFEYKGKRPISDYADHSILEECQFTGNRENLRCSMAFKLNEVWKCGGLDVNPLVGVWRSVRRFLSKTGLDAAVYWLLTFLFPAFGMMGFGCGAFTFFAARFSFSLFVGGLVVGLCCLAGSVWISNSVRGVGKFSCFLWAVFGILIGLSLYGTSHRPEALVITIITGFFAAWLNYELRRKPAQQT